MRVHGRAWRMYVCTQACTYLRYVGCVISRGWLEEGRGPLVERNEARGALLPSPQRSIPRLKRKKRSACGLLVSTQHQRRLKVRLAHRKVPVGNKTMFCAAFLLCNHAGRICMHAKFVRIPAFRALPTTLELSEKTSLSASTGSDLVSSVNLS